MPPVLPLVDLLLQLIGQKLQIVDVDLTVCETLPLSRFVDRFFEFPCSRGAGSYQPLYPLFAFYLLLLLAVRGRYSSSSGIRCTGHFIGYFWVQPIAPPPCNPLHPPPPCNGQPGSCSA